MRLRPGCGHFIQAGGPAEGTGTGWFPGGQNTEEIPLCGPKLRSRVERYNEGVALAKRYAAEGRALIIAPDNVCGLDTLSRDTEALKRFYQKGYQDAEAIPAFLG